MDSTERNRLLHLLDSVEKEVQEEDRNATQGRELLRRQLFADSGPEHVEEEAIEREGSEQSLDELEQSDHDTNSEVSVDELLEEGEFNEEIDNDNVLLGKDKETKWNVHMDNEGLLGRVRRQNIIRAERIGVRLPTPRAEALTTDTPIAAWKLFFPDSLIDYIVQYTNIWIQKNKSNYSRERDAKETDRHEIHAVLGLLFLAGLLRSSHTRLEDLWATDGLGVEYFRSTMSIKRFKFLLRAIRFDDITTRRQRKRLDKLAPIREVFEGFVDRCQQYYALSEYVTVDEMLEGFRGRCGFRQYIPNKPARYGLKMFALCDARTFYTANLELYAGKQPDGPYKLNNTSREVTLRMIQPISGTGRHLTVDNWYGSVPLAKELLENHRITVVCTLKKNKREIPPVFINNRGREPCSSLFAYQKDCTLLSYAANSKKVVLLVSTFHHSDSIDPESGDKNKPFLLTCYNKYKGGVDTVDQMKSAYSVSRRSNRWPLTVFFALMNISGINSYIILRNNTAVGTENRRAFIRSLGRDLCNEHMIRRSSIPTLPLLLRERLRELCGKPGPAPREEEDPQPSAGRCYLCGRAKNRRSRTRCPRCNQFVCREHTKFTCVECAGLPRGNISSSDDD